jgi:MerR family mercuric resistance operon transcriptional regulator
MRSGTVSRAEGLPIGELSRVSGVNIETIRYYERIKLLPVPRRTDSGYRVYTLTEARTLTFIRRARELGFGLNDVRALLDLAAPGKASCAEARAIATRHLQEVRLKIADLSRLECQLAGTIKRCSGQAVPNCPVLEVLDPSRVA